MFVSSDRTEETFKEYYGTMPWLALPLKDSRIDQLSSYFEVEGNAANSGFVCCGLIRTFIIFFSQSFSHYDCVSWLLSVSVFTSVFVTLCLSRDELLHEILTDALMQ